MANPYSKDLRSRAIELIDRGKKVIEVAKLLKISRASLHLWVKTRKEEGRIEAKSGWRKGHSAKVRDLEFFKEFAIKNCHKTAKEMGQLWGNISTKTICKWLKIIGFTRKKRLMAIKKGMKQSVRYIWTL